MIKSIFRDSGGSLLNPLYLLGRLDAAMMGIDSPNESEPGLTACAFALIGFCGLMVMILERKLRPVEVVK